MIQAYHPQPSSNKWEMPMAKLDKKIALPGPMG
jgi:hypothetical protein